MTDNRGVPTRAEAEALLVWAESQNPGQWGDHSRVVARAAYTIAAECGLDSERAYAMGLLHDIGRYEGMRAMHHIVAGYKLLMAKGYPSAAKICITHSFSVPLIAAYSGLNDCDAEETELARSIIEHGEQDVYDHLIQLCDGLGTAKGVSLIDVRLLDVARRHAPLNEHAPRKWESYFKLKADFDELCGMNIYGLFRDEIIMSIF